MLSYGLLELEYEIRRQASAWAKLSDTCRLAQKQTSGKGNYARARASKNTLASIGVSELSTAGMDPSKAQCWAGHAVHFPGYRITLRLDPQ